MDLRLTAPETSARLFVKYAAISLVPVVMLGAALAWGSRNEARRRGLADARSDARIIARTMVEPVLQGSTLSAGVTASEKADLDRLVSRAVGDHDILRLRLRDLDGRVVYSDDGSGFSDQPDGEAADAGRGEVVSSLKHLNTDGTDSGPAGQAAAEVYLAVRGGRAQPLGVLEIYLPYRPINQDVTSGLHLIYRNLVAGLALLYLALFAITASVSRGLRRLVSAYGFLAEHDSLTALPNRSLFHRRARAAIAANRDGRSVAIAIIDLDRFKEINDTLGHHNGDLLLASLAARLGAHMRPDDTIARLGGDEFGVILRDSNDAEAALQRLRQVIDQEFELSGLPISVEASVGFALAPADGTDADDLLQRADVAMYAAKALHCGVLRYEIEQDHYEASNLSVVSELRGAIETDQLVLHYQPKMSMHDGAVEAVEALVRWEHPVHGLLHPARFLPSVEQSDLIDRLTDWVLARALTEIGALDPEGDMAVAVNVSARNLSRDDFACRVTSILEDTGMPASRLIIEITETALLANPPRAAATLGRLSALGARISIDDFGQGHSSLGYLANLPVDELKIDKGFVQGILDDNAHSAIVRSIIDLGHNLDLQVVAEGVETDEVLDALRAAGCDVAQGYLLAHPMPIDRLREWMAAHRSKLVVGSGA